MKKNLLRLAGIISLLIGSGKDASSFPITNFTASHENYYWTSAKYLVPEYHEKGDPKAFRLNFGASVDWGFSPEGFNKNHSKVDPYSIYSSKENVLPVDLSTLSADAQGKIIDLTNLPVLRALFVDPKDGMVIQHFTPKSTIKEWDFNVFARLALPIESMMGQFEVAAYLPVKYVNTKTAWSVDNSTIAQDGYPPVGALSYLDAKSLFDLVQKGGIAGSLETEKFEQNGIGDLTILSSWKNHFTQVNSELSSVGIYVQSGVTFPTSKKVDPLNILSFSFGNDNAITFPFGGAININFAKNFRICAAANGVISLAETSERLFKIDPREGELFLHNKMSAQRSPGAQVSLVGLAEVNSECKKYCVGIMYHFMKKYEDKFTSKDVKFVQSVANKMERYQEKTTHHVSVRAGVDLSDVIDSDFAPTFSISYRHPMRATRMQAYKILQVEAALNF